MSKWILAAGSLALPFLGFGQQLPRSKDWWDRELWSRIAYSGSRTLGYQNYSFKGDVDAFSSMTNYGTGLQHFTDIGNLSIQGNKVFGLLDFRATFTDNRFSDPEQQQYTLNYRKGDANRGGAWDVSYGTVQASLLSGNRFVNFSRSLNGLSGDFKRGRLQTKFISSEARGAARTVTVEGNNTTGPYYLQSGRIIGGSIKILLDGVELQQGVDYIVDVTVGSVTFVNRVVAPTSTIVASYESYDVSSSGGSIRGAGVAYELGGGAGRVSFNTVQQITGNSNPNGERLELSQGFGFPGAQYPLFFAPIPASVVITIDGLVRSFSPVDDGVSEFYLIPNNPMVVVSRGTVFKTQTLQIKYIPKLIQSVDGDRRVSGFDWRVPVGTEKSGSFLIYSKANGKMAGTPGGDAESIDLRLNEGKGTFKMGFRKIDPGFRTIEQTGFNRNEDASEYGYEYFTKGLTTTFGTANSLVSLSNGTTTTNTRLVTSSASLRYRDPKKAASEDARSQSLNWNKSTVLSADNNNLTSLAYNDTFRNKKLSYGYGVENITGNGRVNGTMTGLGVNSYRTNATYDIGRNWFLTASASKSYVRTDTIKSEGYDYSVRANMAQVGPWTGGIEYSLSDSGVLASLGGFLNGSSYGYGNNGFGNSGGTGIISTGQLKARRTAINATHQAGENLTLGLAYSTTLSEGASTSNSKIDTFSLNSSWRVNSAHTFVLDLVKVKSNFMTSSAGINNSDVISGYLMGNPGKMWSYSMGYNMLKSSGSSIGQDSLGATADISYRFNQKHRLFFNAAMSRTRGLYPQDDKSLQAGYSYSIVSGIALVGKYNFRDLRNLDPTSTSGAFRANGLSIELTFDLSNRR